MIHFLIIALLLVLTRCIIRYSQSHIRFNLLLGKISPQLSTSLSGGRFSYFASGKCIAYCLARRYRNLNNEALNIAGDRLVKDHQWLIPFITLLIFLISALIIFSSDPGPDAELWQWP